MRFVKFKQLSFVSMGLVLTNIVIFTTGYFTGDLIYDKGILWAYSVLADGEYYRILSAMFLHGGITHLFNNMLILWFLGDMIEKKLGHMNFFWLYMCSGIGGNFLSLVSKCLRQDLAGSLGASGAIFGLDGALLAMVLLLPGYRRVVSLPRTLLMIVLSLYSGYTGQNIDNAAHLGGLVTGFLIGIILCLIKRWILRRGMQP